MALVEIKNVSKVYGKGDNKTVALDNVSLEIEKGEFVAILGKSGSGKSTLLHIIGAVDKPTTGEVYVNGEKISKLNSNKAAVYRRREVGIIYQFFNLLPILNVEENITLPRDFDKKKVSKEELKAIIKSLNLEGQEKKLPNQLSGGQQQRVSIGRALIANPSIILADEPTGNLDVENSNHVMDILEKANKELGQTILMITHDLETAKRAGRIIEIVDGKIVKDIKNNQGVTDVDSM